MPESAIRPFLVNPEPKRPSRHCIAIDCGRATTGDKDFCSNHVDDNPYVKALLVKIGENV
jgi:hypothetical protein